MATTAVYKKIFPLALQEISTYAGFNCMCIIDADDLNETTANTSQVVNIGLAAGLVPAGTLLLQMAVVPIVAFKDASDAAFNTTPLIIGDSGSTNRFVTTTELNENASEIVTPFYDNTVYKFTADTQIYATIAAMAGKSLSNIDVGEFHVYMQLNDPTRLSRVKMRTPILSK